MRNIVISLLVVFVAIFSGCSSDTAAASGGAAADTGDTDTGVTEMSLNIAYVMSTGGEITRGADTSEVSLLTNLETNVTTATLTSGDANCTGCTLQ